MTLQTPTKPITRKHRWPPPQGEWTYADYARLPDNHFRYEVIHGELHMSPAPTIQHQRIIYALIKYLAQYFDKRPGGELLPAPVEVNLPRLASPVQPDLLYITQERLHILAKQTIEGAPDLVIEVLSPGTAQYDRTTKFQLYAEAGVREYWLADPDACAIEVYVLRGHAYALLAQFQQDDVLTSELLPDLAIAVHDICSHS